PRPSSFSFWMMALLSTPSCLARALIRTPATFFSAKTNLQSKPTPTAAALPVLRPKLPCPHLHRHILFARLRHFPPLPLPARPALRATVPRRWIFPILREQRPRAPRLRWLPADRGLCRLPVFPRELPPPGLRRHRRHAGLPGTARLRLFPWLWP